MTKEAKSQYCNDPEVCKYFNLWHGKCEMADVHLDVDPDSGRVGRPRHLYYRVPNCFKTNEELNINPKGAQMSIEHCGKKWKTKYCGDCGACVNGDSPLAELISYIDSRIKYWENKLDTGKDVAKSKKERDAWTKRKEILELTIQGSKEHVVGQAVVHVEDDEYGDPIPGK